MRAGEDKPTATDSPTASADGVEREMTDVQPLPWRPHKWSVGVCWSVVDVNGFCITPPSFTEAEARFVCAAVNAHHDLVTALKRLISVAGDASADRNCHSGICSVEKCARCSKVLAAHAAIAKAEGR
jgi:hypothetical protein